MKPTNAFIGFVLSLNRSNWLQSALCALVCTVVLLGATGCQPHH
jgi:hypothetical protein